MRVLPWTDISSPTEEILTLVARSLAEGTAVEEVLFWRRAGDRFAVVAGWPTSTIDDNEPVAAATDVTCLPCQVIACEVHYLGELLGAVSLRKRRGAPVTATDLTLLRRVANQAGLALRNVPLTAELLARLQDLRRSRQRLVTAQDAERRRLERDLHDGAQQQLLGLKAKVGAARAWLDAGDAERVSDVLTTLSRDTDGTIASLLELARGIHPPILVERGLAAALNQQARRAPLPVTVDARVYTEVVAPSEAEPTVRAYLASTPRV